MGRTSCEFGRERGKVLSSLFDLDKCPFHGMLWMPSAIICEVFYVEAAHNIQRAPLFVVLRACLFLNFGFGRSRVSGLARLTILAAILEMVPEIALNISNKSTPSARSGKESESTGLSRVYGFMPWSRGWELNPYIAALQAAA